MLKQAYLSLGSNVGDREANLQRAVDALAGCLSVRRISSVWETEPQDLRHQAWFLNLVMEAETEQFPVQLLHRIHLIEHQLGRQRVTVKGPRVIDIDILLFGRFVVDTPGLVIPHPRLHERRFVLEPLCELASDLRHPVVKKTMQELLGEIAGQAARKVSFHVRLPSIR
jgi:2-amino-4-hydroxy-6-hydroxymethyldihydropteridine diphosphokinase